MQLQVVATSRQPKNIVAFRSYFHVTFSPVIVTLTVTRRFTEAGS